MTRSLFGLLVLAAAALLDAQSPVPPMPKGTNVVFGRVVDMGTGGPIAGAVVSLALPNPEPLDLRLVKPPRSVMTTADGYFLFRDLPAGRYSLEAAAFGYAATSYPQRLVDITDSDRPLKVAMRLSRYGSISGTVIDEQGEPVAGVPVTALRRKVQGGGLVLTAESLGVDTDDRGVYRIAQLPPGNYIVGVLATSMSLPAGVAADIGPPTARGASFRELLKSGALREDGDGLRLGDVVLQHVGPVPPIAPDGRLLTYATTLAPGTANAAEATVVALGSGESRAAVDVPLRFFPEVRVSGVATGPNGPMRTLAVRLVPLNTERLDAYTADLQPAGVATAVTDATGAFMFAAVAPGQYIVKSSLAADATADEPAVSLWAAQPLNVGDKNVTGVSVVMQPGIRVSGRLEFKDATAPVLTGTQVVVIGLRPIGVGFWRTIQSRITSGDTFTSAGDPPGRYIVNATSNVPGWTLQSVSRGTRPLADDVLDLEEDVRDLVFTYSRKATKLSGTIADASGAPDLESTVVVFPADTTFWREGIFSSRRVRRMPATSAAAFDFTGLAPGDYYVAAVSTSVTIGWDDPAFYDRLIAGATKVTLDPGEEETVALKTFTPRDR